MTPKESKKKSKAGSKSSLEHGGSMASQPKTLPFFLPRISTDESSEPCCQDLEPDISLDHTREHHSFSLRHLAWAIQNGADVKGIARYVQYFDASEMKESLCEDVGSTPSGPYFPILYFAVERNSPETVRVLCEAGAKATQLMRPSGLAIIKLPLLAYSVLSSEYDLSDTTDTFIVLLAMGANPHDMPTDMWGDYSQTPTKAKTGDTDSKPSGDLWCTPEIREALCRNLNLVQRYVLWRADKMEHQTPRMREIIAKFKMQPLFETIYHIIGQRRATEQSIQSITDHVMFGDRAPLVLFFTGPSGHGKTELARQMGSLLSLSMHTVDCAEMKHETDLFGPKAPYIGYEEGSPLNNFLWESAGERCVVFLDEVEKTTLEVRNAMLKLFEEGHYKDRRLNKSIDCTKIIWILASNLGSEAIQKFWVQNLKDRPDEQHKEVSFTKFEKTLKASIINSLGAPFTGRMTAIVPFMPFSLGEQAVATYKFMRKLWATVRKPIDVASKRFPHHLYLNYNDDASIALYIAKGNYSAETGARSLEHAVNKEIRARLSCQFLGEAEPVVDEMNKGPLPNYEVQLISVEKDVDGIHVERKGTKQIQRPVPEETAPPTNEVDWWEDDT